MSEVKQISVDATGRLDIVLRRLVSLVGEPLARQVEQRVGIPFWDGPKGLGAVCLQKIDTLDLSEPITPMDLAERVGFLPAKRRKKLGRVA